VVCAQNLILSEIGEADFASDCTTSTYLTELGQDLCDRLFSSEEDLDPYQHLAWKSFTATDPFFRRKPPQRLGRKAKGEAKSRTKKMK
jgi:hypothetical protein